MVAHWQATSPASTRDAFPDTLPTLSTNSGPCGRRRMARTLAAARMHRWQRRVRTDDAIRVAEIVSGSACGLTGPYATIPLTHQRSVIVTVW